MTKTLGLTALLLAIQLTAMTANAAPPECAVECHEEAECRTGEMCISGLCQMRSLYCLNTWVAANDRGDTYNCFPYGCDAAHGRCFRECESSDQCMGAIARCEIETHRCVTVFQWSISDIEYPQPPRGCTQSCGRDEDCGNSWERCVDSQCFAFDQRCIARSTTMDRDYHVSDCGEYICEPTSGSCLHDCVTTNDCTLGFACDIDRRVCVAI